MLAPVLHILPFVKIRRERTLPFPGRVVVRKGQLVAASDVIAEASLAPEHLMLNIARGLGVSEDLADSHLQVKAGVRVLEGDVLAGPVGLAKRVMRTPRNGRIVLAGGGQVLLEVESPKHELKAGLPGMVTDLLGDRGAVIETTGALIQGVWGNGRAGAGLMTVLAHSPDERLTADRIDISLRGLLILAGYCRDADVLKAAADLPLRGLILASMDSTLISLAAKMPYPILILDGFGQLPMNSAAYKLLSTSEKREVAVNAESWDRFKGTRPEAVIHLPAAGELPLPNDGSVFSSGQQVRALRAPHIGKIGTLMGLRPGSTVFPSGIQAQAGEVRLESGEIAVLPLANLEVLA
jgi:hypothetical protein